MKPKTLIILGPVGSGKGTQANFLANKFGWLHLSSGELLRNRTRSMDALGKRLAVIMKQGKLVPSWVPFMLVLGRVISAGLKKSVIIDGSPRSIDEAEMFDEAFRQIGREHIFAIHIDISERETMERLLKRARSDDNRNAIQERIRVFKKEVMPVIHHYQRKGVLVKVNGEQSRQGVFEEMIKKLKKKKVL